MDNFDREFALQYISDTCKSIYGGRPDYSELLELNNKELQRRMRHLETILIDSSAIRSKWEQ
jgi:hypothetical protein